MDKELSRLVDSVLDYLHLPHDILLTVKHVDQNIAGSYERNGSVRRLNIYIQSWFQYRQILAVICHECTHYFMDYHGLNTEEKSFNEIRTDTMASIIGFGKILQSGYTELKTQCKQGSMIYTTTHTVGYLPAKHAGAIAAYRESIQQDYQRILQGRERQKEWLERAQKHLRNTMGAAQALVDQLEQFQPPRTSENADLLRRAYLEYENSHAAKMLASDEALLSSCRPDAIENAALRQEKLIVAMMRWARLLTTGQDIFDDFEKQILQLENVKELDKTAAVIDQYRMFCTLSLDRIEQIERLIDERKKQLQSPGALLGRLLRRQR